MNDIYPSKDFFRSKFGIEENSCKFCGTDIESTEHVFFDCNYSINYFGLNCTTKCGLYEYQCEALILSKSDLVY